MSKIRFSLVEKNSVIQIPPYNLFPYRADIVQLERRKAFMMVCGYQLFPIILGVLYAIAVLIYYPKQEKTLRALTHTKQQALERRYRETVATLNENEKTLLLRMIKRNRIDPVFISIDTITQALPPSGFIESFRYTANDRLVVIIGRAKRQDFELFVNRLRASYGTFRIVRQTHRQATADATFEIQLTIAAHSSYDLPTVPK